LFTAVFCLLLAAWMLGLAGPDTPRAAAADDDENQKTDQQPSTAAKPKVEQKGLLEHMVDSVGPVFGPLLVFISVALIAIIVLLFMDLRMASAVPPGFVEDFTDIVNKRQFKQAYELARNDPSFLGRVMTTGMARLQYGIEDAREAAFNMVDSIKAGKEQLISYLATIGTLGPLLGLVGTVWGMILTFLELRVAEEIKPNVIADKISHALVVTLVGVALSVPAIFFHTFFRNRLIRLSMETGNVADDLLTQMYHNSKKAAGPGAASAGALAMADAAPAADGRAAAAGAGAAANPAIKPK
jgi:biopolymer transport protein ExbB